MTLLNYTTEIDPEKSIAEIQKTLAAHGANAILAEYENGNVSAISFRITVDGKVIGFRLPSDWRPVLKVLEQQKERLRRAGQRKHENIRVNETQARRVAWRIVKDWVEAQMAIIELQMASLDQVFLPYAMTPSGRTLYEVAKTSNLLSAPND